MQARGTIEQRCKWNVSELVVEARALKEGSHKLKLFTISFLLTGLQEKVYVLIRNISRGNFLGWNTFFSGCEGSVWPAKTKGVIIQSSISLTLPALYKSVLWSAFLLILLPLITIRTSWNYGICMYDGH